MPWSWDEIQRDWLVGTVIAADPAEVVDAFNRVELAFGREWIESSRRRSGGEDFGAAPTYHVVLMGRKIAALDGLSEADGLLQRLRRKDLSASAEAIAIHLLRSVRPEAVVELEPPVTANQAQRKADFRTRLETENWTYVEVTQPDASDAQRQVEAVMNRILEPLMVVKNRFALEVFLRREPSDNQVEYLVDAIPGFSATTGTITKELPDDLGMLSLNHSQPGHVVMLDHPEEENRPRLGCAKIIGGPEGPRSHISVRMAFADDRAEEFLRKESKQLPRDAPGLIMVQIGRAPGAFRSWEPLLLNRFQPDLYTRVSAICLFSGAFEATPSGEAWIPRTKLLPNPYAKIPLPSWISDALLTYPQPHGTLQPTEGHSTGKDQNPNP